MSHLVVEERKTKSIGLYIHIPFCRRRCRYCDFAIVPIGSRAAAEGGAAQDDRATTGFLELNEKYTNALIQEIKLVKSSNSGGQKISLTSIYFGGGTPSLAPVETIEIILNAIFKDKDAPFCLEPGAEISIEMDPGTFSLEKAFALRDLGFNRISLGVQSFDDQMLQSLGRVHRRNDITKAISILETVFGEHLNYSIDLISGLPGLSLAKWADTLTTAIHWEPPPTHLSLYDLQIESGTVFGTWYENSERTGPSTFQRLKGNVPVSVLRLPTEEDAAFMYKYAAGYLRAEGFEHYEVSSYAKLSSNNGPSRWRSRHNQIYWAIDSHWYAFGLGATSYVQNVLTARPRTLVDYFHWVKEQHQVGAAATLPVMEDFDLLMDTILKRLRTSEGLSLEWIRRRFGRQGNVYAEVILKGAQLGLELGLATFQDNVLRLSDPHGFLYSNSIISSIYAELENFVHVPRDK